MFAGQLVFAQLMDVDVDHQRKLVFLTNNFMLPATTIAQLYRCRWQIELFFKWLKQHLRIKSFYGNSDNAVKTQVWIAVSIYVLVAILKKELGSQLSLAEILQILSVNTFEKNPLTQLLSSFSPRSLKAGSAIAISATIVGLEPLSVFDLSKQLLQTFPLLIGNDSWQHRKLFFSPLNGY